MESIKVICHSIGATVMRHLLSMGWLETIDKETEIIAIAPVSDSYCEPLRVLNSEMLTQISDIEAYTILRELSFYIETPRLPLPNIRRQVMLLVDAGEDEVPTTLCLTIKDAAALGREVETVDGFHGLSTITLGSI